MTVAGRAENTLVEALEAAKVALRAVREPEWRNVRWDIAEAAIEQIDAALSAHRGSSEASECTCRPGISVIAGQEHEHKCVVVSRDDAHERIATLEAALRSAYAYRETMEGLPKGTLQGPLAAAGVPEGETT